MLKNSLKINSHIPNSSKKEYIYELNLILKDNQVKNFFKIHTDKFIEFDSDELNIDYNLVKNFNLNVTIINTTPRQYKFSNDIDINEQFNIFQSNNLYIEFNNKNNKLNCNCYVKENNTNLFLTPPNY